MKTPYRFQMYMPEEMRDALRDVAYRKKISMNALVYAWLEQQLQDAQHEAAPPQRPTPAPSARHPS